MTAYVVVRLEAWLTANDADFVILLEETNDILIPDQSPSGRYDQTATAGNLGAMLDLVLADGATPAAGSVPDLP